jgi:hypothetical protein
MSESGRARPAAYDAEERRDDEPMVRARRAEASDRRERSLAGHGAA